MCGNGLQHMARFGLRKIPVIYRMIDSKFIHKFRLFMTSRNAKEMTHFASNAQIIIIRFRPQFASICRGATFSSTHIC